MDHKDLTDLHQWINATSQAATIARQNEITATATTSRITTQEITDKNIANAAA